MRRRPSTDVAGGKGSKETLIGGSRAEEVMMPSRGRDVTLSHDLIPAMGLALIAQAFELCFHPLL